MKKLEGQALREALRELDGWARRGEIIRREYQFMDFAAAMRFVNGVARLAEKANHHPDIDVRWNRVKLALTTHDAQGLTTQDIELAGACNRAAERLRR